MNQQYLEKGEEFQKDMKRQCSNTKKVTNTGTYTKKAINNICMRSNKIEDDHFLPENVHFMFLVKFYKITFLEKIIQSTAS